jgi:tRNA modification GTPase
MNDTISAISTPLQEAGIGIVRISGPSSLDIIDKIFRGKNIKSLKFGKTHRLYYGHIIDPSNNEVIDEVLVSVMKKPNTYTREDVVEINCHSGVFVLNKILELTIKYGARLAEPGEFTKRAFLNGRIDLSQAEAVIELIRAKTEKSLKLANKILSGELSLKIKEIRDKIINLLAQLEVEIDYPEEDIEEISKEEIRNEIEKIKNSLDYLISSYSSGKILKYGVTTTIVGRPNVGKSSLFNRLVGKERVIVTEIPGTTRDVVEDTIIIEGILFSLRDTAGWRKSFDKIEKIGIEYTKKAVEETELILLVIDSSEELKEEDREIIEILKDKNLIIVYNKIDLPEKNSKKIIENLLPERPIVETSTLKNQGIENLKKLMKEIIKFDNTKEDILITNLRHKELLEKCKNSLENALISLEIYPLDIISLDLKEAINYLGEITGINITEELLDKIFSQFCVGK